MLIACSDFKTVHQGKRDKIYNNKNYAFIFISIMMYLIGCLFDRRRQIILHTLTLMTSRMTLKLTTAGWDMGLDQRGRVGQEIHCGDRTTHPVGQEMTTLMWMMKHSHLLEIIGPNTSITMVDSMRRYQRKMRTMRTMNQWTRIGGGMSFVSLHGTLIASSKHNCAY